MSEVALRMGNVFRKHRLGGAGGDFLCRRNIMDEDVGSEESVQEDAG